MSEFLNFVNKQESDNEAKIALLTNTAECVFVDSEDIYNAADLKAGVNATQDELEKIIDEIYDKAIFGCENIFLVSTFAVNVL